MEMLSLFFKAVCYTNILEKVVLNKAVDVSHLKDRQKCKKHMENYILTVFLGGNECFISLHLTGELPQENNQVGRL